VIRRSRGGKGKSDPLTTRIKQVIDRQAETKYAATQIIDDFIVPYTVGPAAQFFPCTAQVLQGVQSNQRVGERIKPVRVKLDFTFAYDPTSTVSHDYRVKLFVLRPKTYNNFPAMVASGFTGLLLDNGDQTSADWDPLNQHISDAKPVDNEAFNPIMIKRFKLIKNTSTVEGTLPGGGNVPNTSRSSVVRYSMNLFGKALKKHLTYTGAVAPYPTNYNPIFGIVAYAADGSAPAVVSPIRASVRLHMWFKDE
jgi:hypothetical protein